MAKRPTKALNTPKGELNWVFITGEGKEDLNGNPRYSAAIYFEENSADLKKFQAEIMSYWEEHKPKTAKKPKSIGIYLELKEKDSDKTTVSSVTQPFDTDEYVKTGRVCVQAWTGVTNHDGSPKRIKTYNAKGSEVSLGSKSIGNGSIGRLGLTAGIYENGANVGVTLYLNGIQLTKFVEYTAGSSFEADDDEDGFTGLDGDFDSLPQEEDETSAPAATKKVRL